MTSTIFKAPHLPPDIETQLLSQHESEMGGLLPILGPLFGASVLLFSIWDYFVDAEQAYVALLVRIGFVLAGSAAYWPTRLKWTPTQRYAYIYCTHASAIVICEFLLKDGFLYGLAGVTACVFAMSVTTLRLQTFLKTLSIPFILFVALTAVKVPALGFINGVALYFFSVCLACVILLVMRFLRRKAFMLEYELTHISRHDSLTGIYNRGYLTELAEREVALAQRHGRPLAVAMLDIDHFKQVNDTYGHDIGDMVIKALTDTCVNTLRRIDHIGRIGGEEFACVLPETSAAEAMACGERMRKNIEEIRLTTPQGTLQFTVSIGIAVLSPRHANWTTLLKDADIALYGAKQEGRNRVVFAANGLRAVPREWPACDVMI